MWILNCGYKCLLNRCILCCSKHGKFIVDDFAESVLISLSLLSFLFAFKVTIFVFFSFYNLLYLVSLVYFLIAHWMKSNING